ncbi:MAG: YraN family protein [Nitrospiraceae bacterium]|nr:MAG: YraN family protein [Nitrospiraceae bacterium]
MVKLGHRGEDLAVKFLEQTGYVIIQRNFKTAIGEIDIIARDNESLVFIEVKTRESLDFGYPYESVTRAKRKKIANVASLFLKKLRELPQCRFDIVSICHKKGKPEFELIKDAFEI